MEQIAQILAIVLLALLIKIYYFPRKQQQAHRILKKVLLVDDDIDIIRLATKVLTQKKIEVVSSQNPQHALEILKKCNDIDLLITDIYMPEMDGIQLSEYAHDKLPVLIISGGPRNNHLDQIFRNSDGSINKKNLHKKLFSYAVQAVTNWNTLKRNL